MKHFFLLIALPPFLLLSACSPHPASGVWETTGENKYGITKLVLNYDGKAYFTTTLHDKAEWRCFWTASSNIETILECTPSTNPDHEEHYTLMIDDKGMAQMKQNQLKIASFIRLDENPLPAQ